MLSFSSLASSSSGNCYYVASNQGGILIDAGIPLREIKARLRKIDQDIENVKAVFLSHEHIDHVKAAGKLLDSGIPVYANKGTAEGAGLGELENLKTDHPIELLGMSVLPFSKSHDANEPVSYRITNGACVSVITDCGYGCKNVIESIKHSDALILEANHDAFMLKKGPYPEDLKKRILGNKGHLSNYQAALLLLEHAKPGMRHIVLGHLSETNNNPSVALQTIQSILSERKDLNANIQIAPPYSATPLLQVG